MFKNVSAGYLNLPLIVWLPPKFNARNAVRILFPCSIVKPLFEVFTREEVKPDRGSVFVFTFVRTEFAYLVSACNACTAL